MKSLSLSVVTLSILAIVFAQPTRLQNNDQTLIARLDTEYQAAVKNHDVATMDRILADDFLQAHSQNDRNLNNCSMSTNSFCYRIFIRVPPAARSTISSKLTATVCVSAYDPPTETCAGRINVRRLSVCQW